VVTGFAPTADRAVAPAAGSVAFAGFAPAQGGSIQPGTAAVTVTGFAPTQTTTVAPAKVAVVVTGFAPTANAQVSPGTRALTVTGFVPTIPNLGQEVAPITGALWLDGKLPRPDLQNITHFVTVPNAELAGSMAHVSTSPQD
jgi:hypothetical protein